MTNYKPYTVYEEDEEYVFRIPKADFKKAEINNVLKNYFDFIEITKKSKATKKQANEIIKSINRNLTQNLRVK